jgi:hypothetical protein
MNTATPMQSFLLQMKKQAAQQKAGGNGRRSYFAEPVYSRYMGNTGLGEDGRLQSSNPTAMLRSAEGPVMVHDGEDMYQRPDGDMRRCWRTCRRAHADGKRDEYSGRQIGGLVKNAFDIAKEKQSMPQIRWCRELKIQRLQKWWLDTANRGMGCKNKVVNTVA